MPLPELGTPEPQQSKEHLKVVDAARFWHPWASAKQGTLEGFGMHTRLLAKSMQNPDV